MAGATTTILIHEVTLRMEASTKEGVAGREKPGSLKGPEALNSCSIFYLLSATLLLGFLITQTPN